MSELSEFVYMISVVKPGRPERGEMLASERPNQTLIGNAVADEAEAKIMFAAACETLSRTRTAEQLAGIHLRVVRFRRMEVVEETVFNRVASGHMEVRE